ncbi:hypothetical protein GOZ89_03865 [Agrobacterium vitis]|uniref:hypothetical protein n=1 Tax=Agrobacterium vitis TaxID=373 RepID=UPI0012E7C273|nr:hypothetical protein [Agrobacterium vitis]MCF1466166.1 hypothetical protein [Agrobacterium vitis]MVA78547.1 hypothetical protein [Agrobacterium vitis]
MPDFDVSSSRLKMKPFNSNDVSEPMSRMGRGPSLDYITYAPGPREVASRNAVGGAAASVLRMGSEALNSYALTHWAKKWLENNETKILAKLMETGDGAFVVQVNYMESDANETRTYLSRDIYLLGTVPKTSDAGRILTADLMYGPKIDAQRPNNSIKFRYAYLVGERL